MLSMCTSPRDVIDQYLNDLHPGSMSAASIVKDPLRTQSPYPQYMSPMVNEQGLINDNPERKPSTPGKNIYGFMRKCRKIHLHPISHGTCCFKMVSYSSSFTITCDDVTADKFLYE